MTVENIHDENKEPHDPPALQIREFHDLFERAALIRALGIWMSEVLLPSRLPGVEIPKCADLFEVKKMIDEHKIDWTREWKDKGRAEGCAETLGEFRRFAQENLEVRFGALPPEAQERLSALESVEAVGVVIARSATAASLAELGLL